MASNAQDCLNKLSDELLGKNYYITDSVGCYKANETLTEEIIERYKKIPFKEKIKLVFKKCD